VSNAAPGIKGDKGKACHGKWFYFNFGEALENY